MKLPQIIMIAWLSLGLLCSAYQHGKPKTGRSNVRDSLVGSAIFVGLLIWGGYFG